MAKQTLDERYNDKQTGQTAVVYEASEHGSYNIYAGNIHYEVWDTIDIIITGPRGGKSKAKSKKRIMTECGILRNHSIVDKEKPIKIQAEKIKIDENTDIRSLVSKAIGINDQELKIVKVDLVKKIGVTNY